jgi:hypothetical protein
MIFGAALPKKLAMPSEEDDTCALSISRPSTKRAPANRNE